MPATHEKSVTKWNSLLSTFLNSLMQRVPDVDMVVSARDFVDALIALRPAETEIVERFMMAMRNAGDFIAARNTDVFDRASEIADVVSKEDVIAVYKRLDADDRATCWKYLSKLYALGKKACPDIATADGEFDVSALQPRHPIAGLIEHVKSSPPAGRRDAARRAAAPDLFVSAFRTMSMNLLTAVAAARPDDAELGAICADGLKVMASESDPEAAELLKLFAASYADLEIPKGLMTDAETVVREHGLPYIGGGGELGGVVLDSAADPSAVISAAMQLGTVYLTMTQLSPAMRGKMAVIAQKVCGKMESGELQVDTDQDPMSMLLQLAGSGMDSEIMELLEDSG